MSEQAERFYSEWYTNESAERTEEPKREFIVALDLENADIEGNIPIANTEEIVRCRDCGKWDAEGEPHAIHPERHWCDEFAHYVAPDGFCAWGERRDA